MVNFLCANILTSALYILLAIAILLLMVMILICLAIMNKFSDDGEGVVI